MLCLPSIGVAIPLGVPRVVVTDRTVDPLQFGDRRGGVISINYERSAGEIGSVAAGFRDPHGVAILKNKTMYVADLSADPLGIGGFPGAVWHVNPNDAPQESRATLVAASVMFKDPVDLVIRDDGMIILVDRNADPYNYGRSPGALFLIDPETSDVDVLVAHDHFSDPRSLAWDIDGNLLVLDAAADPLDTGQNSGAIFKVNPRSGAITVLKALDGDQVVSPTAVAVDVEGNYLIVDQDGDPSDSGTRRGAMFKLDRTTGKVLPFLSHPWFEDPTDVVIGLDGDIWLMDISADTDGSPQSEGSLFGFRANGDLFHIQTTPLFKALSGIAFSSGAAVDGSGQWTDEGGGVFAAGDLVTVRVELESTGQESANGVVLVDSLAGEWALVPGSDSTSTGTFEVDWEEGIITWSGDIPAGETAVVKYRKRSSEMLESGESIQDVLTVDFAGNKFTIEERFLVSGALPEGTVVFVDSRFVQGERLGFVFEVDPDSDEPAVVFAGAPLVEPVDALFLDNGTLAILDRSAVEVQGVSGKHAIFLFDAGEERFTTLWTRDVGDGMVDPSGIGLDVNGDLILIDRESNPFDLPFEPGPQNFGPGAAYRIPIETGLLTPWFSDSLMSQPVDCEVDENGIVVVLDFEGPDGHGALFEYDRIAGNVEMRDLNPVWFRDPLGLSLRDNLAYIVDPTDFEESTENDRGGLYFVERGEQTLYGSLSRSSMMKDPADCFIDDDGIIYITDRDADPLGFDRDTGAIFKYDTTIRLLSLAGASFSLVKPDGITGYYRSKLNALDYSVTDRNKGQLSPGDTVDVSFELWNESRRAIPQAMIEIEFGEVFSLLEAESGGELLSKDDAGRRAAWTGRLARNDTIRVDAVAVVEDGFSFGTAAVVTTRVFGGEEPLEFSHVDQIVGSFNSGDIVVVDKEADPRGVGGRPGGLFTVGPDRGDRAALVAADDLFRDPIALEWTETREILVADSQGSDPGAIFRIDGASGSFETVISGDSLLPNPVDLLWTPSGDLLVVDSQAPNPTEGALGAVYRLPNGSTPLELFSSEPGFREISEAVFDHSGRLFLSDRDGDPDELGGSTGAIWELDPSSGEIIGYYQEEHFREPTGLTVGSDSSLVVTDLFADPLDLGGATGALFSIDQEVSAVDVLMGNRRMISPYRSFLQSNGNLFIIDQSASNQNQSGFPGLVFDWSPATGSLREFAISDSFSLLSDLALLPTSQLSFDSYELTDPNGIPLYAADRLRLSASLSNRGPVAAVGAAYRDTIPGEAEVIATSLSASSGSISVEGSVVIWGGDVESNASVELSYEVQLRPFDAEGEVLTFRGTAFGPAVGTLVRTTSATVFVTLDPGKIYVADADADPPGYSGLRGAILKVDQRTGSMVPYFASPTMRQPIDVAVHTGDTPRFFVLDQQARPEDGSGRGVVFEIDSATQALTVFGSDPTLVNPVDMLLVGETLIVLDSWADPFDLTPGLGPGAVYSLSLENGEMTTVASDTSWVSPAGIAALPDGRVALLDSDANPENFPGGASTIFAVALDSGESEIMATDERWEELVAGGLRGNGDLMVLDEDASPDLGVGSVWTVSAEGDVELFETSEYFARLGTVLIQDDGSPFVSDRDASLPSGGTGAGGIFFKDIDGTNGFRPYSSSALLRDPRGMFIYQDVTPVVSLRAAASTVEDGIELEWDGFSDQDRTRYLLFRRVAEGPDDPGDPSPEGYAAVFGPEEFRGAGPHVVVDRSVAPNTWYVYLIAVAYDDGLVDYSQPILGLAPETLLRFELLPARPNPFQSSVLIRFAVPSAGDVRLSIHDVSGRRIRNLAEETFQPGLHQRTWDARSDAGHRIPSGVYFARLEHSGATRSQRIVLVK